MSSEKNTPKIRFKGFTDPWEQRKLKELGDTYSGLTGKSKNDFGHGDAFYIPYLNIFTNSIVDNSNLEKIDIDSKQHAVNYGDVLFTVSSETPEDVGMTSIYMGNKNNVYLNSFCFGYRLNKHFDLFFLSSYFRSNVFRKSIEILAQGISRYNISKNKVMSLKIFIPTDDEQSNIGCLLNHLDDTITANQRKLDELKNVKKLLMQKIFSQEWRFKGFTDPWEQRKLGQIARIQGGGTPDSKNKDYWDGDINWFTPTEVGHSV
ncbi:restriction endonuclease subunit S, partial [Pediococcus argentinicus]|uniref:restriction endonuclease subunit S n=2 Tax=Pediococcus argentinicus TaxID=480391 RepID=UPI0016948D4E